MPWEGVLSNRLHPGDWGELTDQQDPCHLKTGDPKSPMLPDHAVGKFFGGLGNKMRGNKSYLQGTTEFYFCLNNKYTPVSFPLSAPEQKGFEWQPFIIFSWNLPALACSAG